MGSLVITSGRSTSLLKNTFAARVIVLSIVCAAFAKAAAPISDDFHATTLNTGLWSFVNPVGNGSFAITGSNLLLTVPAGSNHDPQFGGADNAARVMQNITNVDFQVEAKFDSKPSSKYQLQGIIVEQDAANYLALQFVNGGVLDVSAVKVIGSTATSLATVAITAGSPSVWMRVQKAGTTWTCSWSADGTTYSTFSTFTQALTPARTGPFAGNYGSPTSTSPGFTASVDYFFNTASPITPEDGGGPGMSRVTATPSGTSATLTWTTDMAADSRVDYGTSTSYGSTASATTQVTSHSVSLTGLNCGTLYDFQATSATASGSTASPNGTFTTGACAGAPDLTVTKSHSGNFTQGGAGTYSITVTNSGGSPTSGAVNVTDTLPSDLTQTSMGGTGWVCSIATLSCSRNDALAAAASYPPIILMVTVASNAASSVTNTVQVFGGGETDTANDSASDPTTIVPATTGTGPVSDDFHATALNTGLWTLVNPVGDGTFAMTGSNLLLNAPGGAIHDPQYGNQDRAVRMMQNISNTDFQVEAKFDSKPTKGYQMQGIMAEQDASNYIRFEIVSSGSSLFVSGLKVVAGTQTSLVTTAISYGNSVWLRMQKSGNTWTGTWSSNGSTFSTIISFSQAMTPVRVGPYAANWGSPASASPAFTASVDYFFNSASPISPEDAGGPGLSLISVTPGSTSATLTWTTDVAASSQVDYGTSTSYGTTASDSTQVTSHSATITGLTCGGTVYDFKVTSATASGSTVSPNGTFTTGACAGAPDLTIAKSHSGNFTQGGTGSYTITVTNSGGSATSGTVTVTDTLPSGLTATAISGSGWSCSTPPTLSCTRTDTLGAGSAYPAIALAVSVASNAPSSATNTAQVSGGGETNTTNDSASDPTTISATTSSGPTSDEFHALTLNSGLWTFVNPVGDGTFGFTGSNLLLTAPGGAIHDPEYGNQDRAVRMMQNISGDFGVEVKFDSKPSQGYQMQGVIAEQDATNYIRFEIVSNGSSLFISGLKVVANTQTSLVTTAISYGNSVWVRMQKSGNTWTGTWSADGTTYNSIISFSQGMTPARVGVYAANYGSPASASPAFTASVEYFFNMASPITPEDATGPDQSAPSVSAGTTTATVAWTSDAATGRVDYGATTSYGQNVSDTSQATSHSLNISGLTCATTYNFKITSTNSSGSTASPNGTFTTGSCSGGGTAPVSDNFESGSLKTALWTFVDPVGNSFLAFNKTSAQITVPAGSQHDPWASSGNQSARIMQPMTATSFNVVAKYMSELDWGTTGQGIVVEQDATNYLRFEFRFDGTTTSVFAGIRSGSTMTTVANTAVSIHSPLWLQVTRSGNSWTVSWSADGTTFTQASSFSQALNTARIGLYAYNLGSNKIPAFTSSVDFFMNTEATVENADAPMPYARIVVDKAPGAALVEKTMADLDGDGRPDAIIGLEQPSQGMFWYRNPHSGNVTDAWSRFTVASTGTFYEDVIAFDVNGDGAKDLIASVNGGISWFQNPLGSGGDPTTPNWTAHVIASSAPGENGFALADLDGDGKTDIITASHIYFQDSPTSWTSVQYNNAFRGIALLDIGSGKGAINLVTTASSTNFVWFENPRETGGNARTGTWIQHTVGPGYACAPCTDFAVANMAAADLNGDGRMDVVTVQSEGATNFTPVGGIIWWEAPSDRRTGTWIKHSVDPTFLNAHNVRIFDMDKNGTLDLVVAEQEQSPERRLSIYFNDGQGNFSPQVLANSSGHNPFVADINNDGWLDILSSAHGYFGAPNPLEVFMNRLGGFSLP